LGSFGQSFGSFCYKGSCRLMKIKGSHRKYEMNNEGRSSVEVTIRCVKLVHLDVLFTGDEEYKRLTIEAKVILELCRLIK
jgi:hypothetical protein